MTQTTTEKRTDVEILTDARNAIDSRRTIPGGVEVRVEAGVVTLTGRVYRPFERSEAEDAVARIDGVRRVVNDLVVTDTVTAGFEAPDDVC